MSARIARRLLRVLTAVMVGFGIVAPVVGSGALGFGLCLLSFGLAWVFTREVRRPEYWTAS